MSPCQVLDHGNGDPATRLTARARVFGVLASSGPDLARRAGAADRARAVDRVGRHHRAAGGAAGRRAAGRRRTARPRRDGPPARPGRARPRRRASRSAWTSASATCASRWPTSRTACSRSATCRSTPTCPPRRRSRCATRLVDEVLEEAGAARAEIAGVGMGLPGPVHRPTGELGDSTILPGWVGVRAADAMSEALGHHVEVENDASLGALSEWMWGAGRGAGRPRLPQARHRHRRRADRARAPLRRQRRHGRRDRPHDHRPRTARLPLRQPRLPRDARRLGRDPRLAARRRARDRCPPS